MFKKTFDPIHFPGLQVSRNGDVFNRGCLMHQSKNHDGYHVIFFPRFIGGKTKYQCLYVHRMVAERFVRNPRSRFFSIVDHIDRNKSNNTSKNLRWVNHLLNQINKFGKGVYYSPKAFACGRRFVNKKPFQVRLIDDLGNKFAQNFETGEAARKVYVRHKNAKFKRIYAFFKHQNAKLVMEYLNLRKSKPKKAECMFIVGERSYTANCAEESSSDSTPPSPVSSTQILPS